MNEQAKYSEDGKRLISIPKNYEGEFVVPEGVTHIHNHAFWDCNSITSIRLPDTVIGIGDFAFCNCHKLASIYLPDSIVSIGLCAFENCKGL